METLFQDLKFAARQLVKEKGFFVTTALTLALCIGANTTIFSVVHSVLLRPLPFPESDRLVRMWNAYPGAGVSAETRGGNGVPDYYDRRVLTEVFEELAAYNQRGRSIELEGVPQRITTLAVTPSFFELLRTNAAHGRTFTEEEGDVGNDKVVVLSHGLWQQAFGGAPSALGAKLRLDGSFHIVVGIMPESFVFLDPDVRLWSPIAFPGDRRMEYHSNNYGMVARLAPGVSLEQAQERIDALNASNIEKLPHLKSLLIDAGFHTPLYFLQDDLVRDIRPNLYLLWGGVAFVLLIGGVNVANLALVRSTARAKELATRCALGASRSRIVRQVLTETLALTLVGGALGLALGHAGVRAFAMSGGSELVPAARLGLDTTVVVFTLSLALLVGMLVSAIPVLGILRLRLTSVFREEGRTGTSGRGVTVLRKGLVASQVALALVLLVGAGLLFSSFERLLAVDPGFDPEGVVTGTVMLTDTGYPEDSDRLSFMNEVLRQIRALPGVERAAVTSNVPFGDSFSDGVIFAEGYVMQEGESSISPTHASVSPDYFEAMGIALRDGRYFDDRDSSESRPVIIIDQRLADRFWPNGDALGKRMWSPRSTQEVISPETADYWDIVGIVEPVRMRGLATSWDEVGMYYFPMSQSVRRALDFTIRSSSDPRTLVGPVRSVISGLDSEMPLFDIRTMTERIERSMSDRRTPMILTAGFSAAALLLSLIGIYGMLSYLVQQRTREIGVRVALGGDTASIFRLILKDGLLVLALGLLLGLAGAVLLRRIIEGYLFGVSALEPSVIASVLAVLSAAALVACVVPARRATRIEPVRALVQE